MKYIHTKSYLFQPRLQDDVFILQLARQRESTGPLPIRTQASPVSGYEH